MLRRIWDALGHISTAQWVWSLASAGFAFGVAVLSGYDPLLIFAVVLIFFSATLVMLYYLPLLAKRLKAAQSDFVPMRDAMADAYTRLRSSTIGKAALNDSRGNEDEVLNFLAISFASHFRVFGRRPPSTELDEIPENVRKHQGRFINGANHFGYYEAGQASWRDLAVKRVDLDSYVGMFLSPS